MFELKGIEKAEVVENCDHLSRLKYSKFVPCAFTEHGAIMVASVLNSQRAIEMSVFVVRAFIVALVEPIRRLMSPAAAPRRRRIDFGAGEP